MSTLIEVKRRRTPRVTRGQINALLAILEARPFLYTRKFTSFRSREDFEEGWQEVALELNKIGSTKTAEQWMTVWRDFKSRACIRAARLKKEIRLKKLGNRAVTIAPLTKLEQRIVSLVGSDSPDSTPEELMTQEPSRVSASEVNTSGFSPVIENFKIEMCTVEDPSVTMRPPTPPTETNTSPQIPGTRTPYTPRRLRNRNLNPDYGVSKEFGAAHQNFLAIAASNAESIKMLAAAANTQAGAARTQAEAMKDLAAAAKQQAEASKMHAESMMIFAEATKSQALATVKLSTAADKLTEVLNILLDK